jgi:protein-disulfide isomerase
MTFRFAAAILAAGLLAACNGESGQKQLDFTPVPVTPVLGDVPLGDPNAPVKLVEYAALTCHVCRDFAKQVLPRLKREYIDTGKVYYTYRDFPLEAGADGKAVDGFGVVLASVARCKGPEKFHELLDGIFAVQGELLDAAREGKAADVLNGVAQQHGMTTDEMRTCIDAQPELNASIKASRNEGADKGVKGTPGIFINDKMLENTVPNYENISAAIEAALGNTPPAEGAAPAGPSAPAPAAPATPPAQ